MRRQCIKLLDVASPDHGFVGLERGDEAPHHIEDVTAPFLLAVALQPVHGNDRCSFCPLARILTGRFRIHENDESGQRDISDQNIARLTDNIAELDGLLAEYEAKRG
jgi:hypothetical protein